MTPTVTHTPAPYLNTIITLPPEDRFHVPQEHLTATSIVIFPPPSPALPPTFTIAGTSTRFSQHSAEGPSYLPRDIPEVLVNASATVQALVRREARLLQSPERQPLHSAVQSLGPLSSPTARKYGR